MKKGIMFFILVLLASLLTSCQPSKSEEVFRETKFLFDTEVYIEAYGSGSERAGKKALERMAAIDQVTNFYSKSSEISKLNAAAGKKTVSLSQDTFELLERSLEIADLTKGAFDPAIGPLVQLWQTAKREKTLPSSKEIKSHLPLTNYRKIDLNANHYTAFLPTIGMSIDLGAIAKGFAVEKGMEILKEAGIQSAMVRAGGNIYTIGEKPDKSSWRVGIRNPLQLDETLGYVEPHNQVVDTSGNYEQSFTIDGKKYGHLIDPRTGYPAEKTASSTIIAKSPALADALATATFILGKKEGLKLIKDTPDVEGMIIGNDGSKAISAGLNLHYK
ncbi:FAD:protein FMN transferase [Cytobacillus sp. Hz8]|uniref:FAD:protein FMN transferase n=1 Tax=Cytobacillus sp. Hz8 TaxID=3347168 RepID=UPI0035DF59FD